MNDLRHQECIGRSRGDLTTKIHVTFDALSNLTSSHLSRIKPYYPENSNVLLETIFQGFLAHKAHATKGILLDRLEQCQVEGVILRSSIQRNSGSSTETSISGDT